MRILLVNDDGLHSDGLRRMRDELVRHATVDVVVPLTEQSGVGHKITYRTPLQAHSFAVDGGHYAWQVDGTPADCVKLGVMQLCDERPDLIVSGINPGANVGLNCFYSGTVAGALEGAMFGIPSFAVSVYLNKGIVPDFGMIAADAYDLIGQLRERQPRHTTWNINFPAVEGRPKGVKLVPMQHARERELVEPRDDPRGRPYYWVGLHPIRNHPTTPGFDVGEVNLEHVAVTPLSLDLTDHTILQGTDGGLTLGD